MYFLQQTKKIGLDFSEIFKSRIFVLIISFPILQDDNSQSKAHFPSSAEEHVQGDVKTATHGLSANNLNHSSTSLGSSSSGDTSKQSYANSAYIFSL